MGHASSRPSTETHGRRPKDKTPSTRTPLLDLNFSASAWTSPSSRFGRRSRSQRRSPASPDANREENARQREEMQRFLAEAMEQQREAERALAEARADGRRPPAPRLVLGDCGEAAGGLEGLKISGSGARPRSSGSCRSQTTSPGASAMSRTRSAGESVTSSSRPTRRERRPSFDLQELQSARSSTPGMSTSSSATPSTLSFASHSPAPRLTSHWSDWSTNEQMSSPITFNLLPHSLNKSQLNRLSVLLANPEKLEDSDIAVANKVLGRTPSASAHRRKGAKVRGPIVVVSAEPIGAGRHAALAQHRTSGPPAARKDSAQSEATVRQARATSPAGVDVWNSTIPFPASSPQPRVRPFVEYDPLSSRFSTTPAELSPTQTTHASWQRPDATRDGRQSLVEELSSYIAASPALAFPSGQDGYFHAGSTSAPPSSRAKAATLSAGHPSSHQARFDDVDKLAVPPVPHYSRRSSSSSSIHFGRRHSSCAPASPRTPLGSAVGSASPSPMSPTGDEVPLCLTPGVVSRISSAEVASHTLSRPATMYSRNSSTSFPHSVAQDDDFSEAGSPFARLEQSLNASTDAAYFDGALPAKPLEAAAYSHVDFSGYSLAPPRPAPAPRPVSYAYSDLPPATLDAFPTPPTFRPEPAPAQGGARYSILSTEGSSLEVDGCLTPSSASFLSSAATSAASIELPASHENTHRIDVDFSAALGASTFAPASAKVATMVDSPAVSSARSSLGTFVLEDLVDELIAAAGLDPVDVYPPEDEGARAEEEAPPVPPKETSPAVSPREWSLAPPPHAFNTKILYVDPHPSPFTCPSPGVAHFPFPPPPPHRSRSPAPLESYRFPPAQQPRRQTIPLPSVTDTAGKADGARLGCREKRGFSRDEIGAWLACGWREGGAV